MNKPTKIIALLTIVSLAGVGVFGVLLAYNTGFNDGIKRHGVVAASMIPIQTEKPEYPRVSFNMNITLVNIKEFSIPRYGLILPANSTYRTGFVIWKGTILSPQSCEISIELLSVDRSQDQPSLYANLPLTITYLETPCNSEGPTTKNIFFNSRSVNSTFPTLIEEAKAKNPIDRVDAKGAQISFYCNGEFKSSITFTKIPSDDDMIFLFQKLRFEIMDCPT